jgi:multiple sugar transport system permease protein
MGVVKRKSPVFSFIRYVLVVIVVCWALFLLYWGVVTSLKPPAETFTISGISIPFVQFKPTAENWRIELSTRESRSALLNSIIVAIAATAIALSLGLPAGYALARFQFRRVKNRDLTVWFLSQRVLPPVAVVIPFFLIMRSLHLLDHVLGLMLEPKQKFISLLMNFQKWAFRLFSCPQNFLKFSPFVTGLWSCTTVN